MKKKGYAPVFTCCWWWDMSRPQWPCCPPPAPNFFKPVAPSQEAIISGPFYPTPTTATCATCRR